MYVCVCVCMYVCVCVCVCVCMYDREALLKRYLIATDLEVEKAAKRLADTIAWRRDWYVIYVFVCAHIRIYHTRSR